MKMELSGSLLRYVGFESKIAFDSPTLGAALDLLFERYPAVKPVLLAKDGQLSRAHQVFLNGTRVTKDSAVDAASLLSRPLTADDTVSILTLITGG